jgi:hypothetical protein
MTKEPPPPSLAQQLRAAQARIAALERALTRYQCYCGHDLTEEHHLRVQPATRRTLLQMSVTLSTRSPLGLALRGPTAILNGQAFSR